MLKGESVSIKHVYVLLNIIIQIIFNLIFHVFKKKSLDFKIC